MSEFERLRQLLLGAEQQQLDRHAGRIDALEAEERLRAEHLPEMLDEARRLRGDERIAQSLAAPVAASLGAAVRDNRQTIVDALFPIIGPAIRKAIAEALRDFAEGFNRALESSLTPRGLRWRFEAWRGGMPYAQVVLRHTLKFRLDHVFLIDRESGLVLHRESAPERADLDADAIAGMLTAIGDFVRDSVAREGSLASATVGEHLLWVIEGPRMNLAAFLRGVPPPQLRTLLEQRLERLHADLADPAAVLQAGSADAGAAFADKLELHELEQAVAESGEGKKAVKRWPLLLALLLALLAGVAWWVRDARWHARVDALRARLAAQPGLVVTGVSSTPWRSVEIRGLRDPDAVKPETLLDAKEIGPDQVRFALQPMLSPDPAITATRARRLLAPPPGVQLEVDREGRLMLRGTAAQAWIDAAREHAPWIAGVAAVDVDGLAPASDPRAQARAQLRELVPRIEELRVEFSRDTDVVDGAEVERLAVALREALALAASAGQRVRVQAYGANDAPGGDAVNHELRARRAAWLREALVRAGVAEAVLEPAGGEVPSGGRILVQRAAGVRLHVEDGDLP